MAYKTKSSKRLQQSMRRALAVQRGRANQQRKWNVRMNAVRREQYKAIAACMSEPQIVASRKANQKAWRTLEPFTRHKHGI